VEYNPGCQQAAGVRPAEFWKWFAEHDYFIARIRDVCEPVDVRDLAAFIIQINTLCSDESFDILAVRS
jgi:hypothetical protein